MKTNFIIQTHLTKCTSKISVLESLAGVLAEQVHQPYEEVFESLMARESVSDTALENGLALPHLISKNCQVAQVCIATLEEEVVDWICLDASKVELLLCLIIPRNYSEQTEGISQMIAVIQAVADSHFVESIRGLTAESVKEKLVERLENG
ncbi:PTS sugar transporter subunit IIA [Streptococcus cuniculi]|uniref:PTS EIIA type-2 domain-containing protein n=1 Tax=Streptococcus cuniculi TaxID=1432788 RepID=A0A4Y9J9K7_9STRE|nr:PTS sugar transporter subunit IIA [Streptococcus cuniculi]MBF0779237.1 PTS sugar transporter subunit IIA [Streptococcus cuniculi]TFU96786.1 hypothetical protein E4T82_11025 [Streptococcus cuniculi]